MKLLKPRVILTRVGELPSLAYSVPQRALDSPSAVADYWREVVAIQPDFEADKELLIAILLNSKMMPQGFHEISRGSLNETIAHPREILRSAIISAAYGLILVHNHPSGDPRPSEADRRVTRRIRECAELMQIRFFDHVIVGNPTGESAGHFSFKESEMT